MLENAEKIHKAAKQGNWEELRMFLGKGLDLEVKDKFGKTPLHTGKDTDFFCFRFFFLLVSINEELCVAAAWGQLEAIEWLAMNTHVNVDARDHNGWTALQVAVSESHVDIARFLLSRGASPVLVNHLGASAIDLAQDQDMKALLGKTATSTSGGI